MKYLLILLFIGLMWGQEYDPETGEVLEKLYNPETGELIEKRTPSDSITLPSMSNVNSNLKDISFKDLSKEQKKIYNQNKIRVLISGNKNYGFFRDFRWSAYIKQSFFKTKRFNQTEFFEITGYPEKARIVKHNKKLLMKNSAFAALAIFAGNLLVLRWDNEVLYYMNVYLVSGYFFYDYLQKKIDGAGLVDAKVIVDRYNNELIQNILNESD